MDKKDNRQGFAIGAVIVATLLIGTAILIIGLSGILPGDGPPPTAPDTLQSAP